jgi:hypothetical protein
MVQQIEAKDILDSYLLHLDDVNFLKEKDNRKLRTKIKNEIEILNDNRKTKEEHFNSGRSLWKFLFKRALTSLTEDSEGYKLIFDYFDEYVEFESMLFGVDEVYRDHTLHSLWVYFLGEYFRKKNFIKDEDIKVGIDFFSATENNKDVIEAFDETTKKVLLFVDEIWCIIALTHDLGYPICTIEKINKKINSIVPYYGKFDKQDFIMQPSLIQKEVIEKLFKIISSDIQFTQDKSPRQILKNNIYVSLYNSMESYDHGVLSSYLLFKCLASMINTPFWETGSEIVHDDEELLLFLRNQAILKSIALHTCKIKRFSKFPSFEALLILFDEIEEFSRWTRAKKKRTFINQLCKVYANISNNNLNIEYVFDDKDLDIIPEGFFKNKCKTFINLFNFDSLTVPEIAIIVTDKRQNPYFTYLLEIKDKKVQINGKKATKTPKEKVLMNKEEIEDYIEDADRNII